jgi:hypothetical protein
MQGSLNRDPLPCSARTRRDNVHGAPCIDGVYHGNNHCWEHPSNGFFLDSFKGKKIICRGHLLKNESLAH